MLKASARRRKAYITFLKVGLSYFRLWLFSKFTSKKYWKSKLPGVHRANAERVRAAIHDLQGLFIKFGQLISTLSNVLPDAFRAPLESLQDKVPPHSFEYMSATIKAEFGVEPSQLFDSIEKEPIAAASIGQVHKGKIGDKEVVVKIQHPTIDQLVAADLYTIKKIVGWAAKILKIQGIEHLYRQVEQMIEEELNYLMEAASMQKIKENLKQDPRVYIPEVFPEYSSKKVLTLEYCSGVKISDTEQIESWGFQLDFYSKLIVELYCDMILRDGFYHADPHPGNVLVNQKGQLVLLDFGAVAQLSPDMKVGIPLLIEAMIKQDTQAIVRMLKQLGFVASGNDVAKVAEQLVDAAQDFVYNDLQLDSLNVQDVSPEQIRKALKIIDIKSLTRIMQIPKDWVLLNRAIVLVGGVVFLLSPNWNPIETVEPYLKKHLRNARGSLVDVFIKSLRQQLTILGTLPAELQKALRKINRGKLTFEHEGLEQEIKYLRLLGQQLIWLLIFIGSVYFYQHAHQGTNTLYFKIGALLGTIGFLGSFLRTRLS